MPRVLCVWFPDWPIQRLRAARPELKETALVLVAESGRGQRVACCSAEAARNGVASGMPVSEARTLLEGRRRSRRAGWSSCFLPADRPADREALRRLCWDLLKYAPHAGLEETDAPESLLLDVSGCSHLFGGEAELLARLREDLHQRGYGLRLALADTLGAAWACAHFAREPLTLLPPGQHRATLESLPPAALRLSGRILETLAELGLDTIGRLAALPRASLPSRFGAEILQRLDQAFGARSEMIVCERPPEPVEMSREFDFPLEDRYDVEQVLRQLLAGLVDRLRASGLGIQRLAIQLAHEAAVETRLNIGLVSLSASAKRLGEVLRLTWERTELTAGIIGVTLRAIDPVPLPARPGKLFDEGSDSPESEWESLLERLSNRLGEKAVVRMEPIADHVPERAFQLVPVTSTPERGPRKTPAPSRRQGALASPHRESPLDQPLAPRLYGGRGAGVRGASGSKSLDDSGLCQKQEQTCPRERSQHSTPSPPTPLPRKAGSEGRQALRPLSLLPRPRPVGVVLASEGLPLHIHWQGYASPVAHSWGPERIETGWWRDAGIRRDYYRIETADGRRLWLYCDLLTRRWWLQGHFE